MPKRNKSRKRKIGWIPKLYIVDTSAEYILFQLATLFPMNRGHLSPFACKNRAVIPRDCCTTCPNARMPFCQCTDAILCGSCKTCSYCLLCVPGFFGVTPGETRLTRPSCFCACDVLHSLWYSRKVASPPQNSKAVHTRERFKPQPFSSI